MAPGMALRRCVGAVADSGRGESRREYAEGGRRTARWGGRRISEKERELARASSAGRSIILSRSVVGRGSPDHGRRAPVYCTVVGRPGERTAQRKARQGSARAVVGLGPPPPPPPLSPSPLSPCPSLAREQAGLFLLSCCSLASLPEPASCVPALLCAIGRLPLLLVLLLPCFLSPFSSLSSSPPAASLSV